LVEESTGQYIAHAFEGSAGYEFHFSSNTTNISIRNDATNSVNILSKPIKILVTYEQ
jgi:hypothetical protein